jgi:hypothetical protein
MKFPSNEDKRPRVLFNPMSEYINRHGEDSFEEFKTKKTCI